MSNSPKSPFDKNIFLAIALTFLIFIGWQAYLKKKYPDAYKKKTVVEKSVEAPSGSAAGVAIDSSDTEIKVDQDILAKDLPPKEEIVAFENERWTYEFSSRGLSPQNVVLKDFNDFSKEPYVFANVSRNFETLINGQPLFFDVMEKTPSSVKGKAVWQGKEIFKTVTIDQAKYSFDVALDLNAFSGQSFKVQHNLKFNVEAPKGSIPLLPSFERQEFFSYGGNGEERIVLNPKTDTAEAYQNIEIAAFGDEYFSSVFINKATVSPNVKVNTKGDTGFFQVEHDFDQNITTRELNYTMFFGPKQLEMMKTISPNMEKTINYGFLAFISKPLAQLLHYLYSLVGNYGFAIILLTFLIRLLILPLAVTGFKSTKKMQKIQPLLKEVKEKYKDNPQMVNQTTMQIMKENKVNPVGGCIPMLLQLPIFFAFYRALMEDVNLYQAPFILWIQDLSKIDPWYVLPVLGAAVMMVQMLLTPTTADPKQKKLMMIMPLFFVVFTLMLPSALTLYILCSTVFGVAQHYVFLREKKTS